MAQDTRKDPRAKVLTMTVRYKSATVDEFIEHHSHDVSRGGIFIKTPSPFLPGTLLKFEIRIADDKAMLQGVGRVVWKRDTAGGSPDKPAGMGVKFIKVDEASRNLIDRLVTSKGGGISKFDEEGPAETDVPAPVQAPAAAAAGGPPGAPPRAGPSTRAAAGSARPSAPSPRGMRKATMIGLGAEAIAAAAAQVPPRPRSQAPRPAAGGPMFPKTNSEADMPPPEERTVMKQAAQLLEEALRGAGGSIDELGSPAAEPPHPPPKPESEPSAAAASPADSPSSDRQRAAAPSQRHPEPAAAVVSRPSVRPRANLPPRAIEAVPALVEPAARKKGSGRVGLSLLLVAGAAAVAYAAWQKQTPAPPEPPVAAAPAVTVPHAPTPTMSAARVESVEAPLAPTASAAAAAVAAAGSAGGVVSAEVPPGKLNAPVAGGMNPAAGKPAAAPAARPAAPPPGVVEGEKIPIAHEKPTAVVEKPPVAVAPKPKPPKPAPEEGAAPAPEKKPKPAPKPSDDNPY